MRRASARRERDRARRLYVRLQLSRRAASLPAMLGDALKKWVAGWIADVLSSFVEDAGDLSTFDLSSGRATLEDLTLRRDLLPDELPLQMEESRVRRIGVAVSILKLCVHVTIDGISARFRLREPPVDEDAAMAAVGASAVSARGGAAGASLMQ